MAVMAFEDIGFTPAMMEVAERQVIEMMDNLPILATQLGCRTSDHSAGESTESQQKLMDALFKVSDTWKEVKP